MDFERGEEDLARGEVTFVKVPEWVLDRVEGKEENSPEAGRLELDEELEAVDSEALTMKGSASSSMTPR